MNQAAALVLQTRIHDLRAAEECDLEDAKRWMELSGAALAAANGLADERRDLETALRGG